MAKSSDSQTFPLDQERFALETVLLLHELPGGSSHVDWMVAKDAIPSSPLITYRMASRIDELTGSSPGLAAERIADHRPEYLEYEGLVSGDRGRVRRLRSGKIITICRSSRNETTLCIKWASGSVVATEQVVRIQEKNPPHSLIFCDSIRRCTVGRDV